MVTVIVSLLCPRPLPYRLLPDKGLVHTGLIEVRSKVEPAVNLSVKAPRGRYKSLRERDVASGGGADRDGSLVQDASESCQQCRENFTDAV